jgi:Tol biopolymer transport system component
VPHPGLGTVAIARPAYVQVVNLATCASTRERPAPAQAGVPVARGNTIVLHGKVLVRIRHGDSLDVAGTSPDGKWFVYSVDRFSSASLAADGLPFFIMRTSGGRAVELGAGLVYAGYRSWCDNGNLVMTVGVSRMAVDNKRLIHFLGPSWLGTNVEQKLQHTAFGSLECAPDGEWIAVQETVQSTNGAYRRPHWSLWRVNLTNAKQTQLTHPPAGWEDDSPHWSPGERTLYFVRAHDGYGSLYALHSGKLVGPLLSLGHNPGYFGETQWRYSVRR